MLYPGILSAFGLIALALVACSDKSNPLPSSIAAPHVIAAGTLAPINSFAWKAAPLYTRLSLTRRVAAYRLREGKMSLEEAETIQSNADAARKLLDRATDVCMEDPHTGNCAQGRKDLALALLAQAQDAVQTASKGVLP